MDATGAATAASFGTANITISADDINSGGSAITINQDSQDLDFVVEGNGDANLFRTDAGSDTVLISTATATTGATLKIDSTDAMMIPSGTTAQRPTGVTSMLRFNTTLDALEFYDSAAWTTAGSDFTVIATQTFNGDNSTVAFTLSEAQTTASCIVSINGVVQLPTTAYAVSGTTLTFTEAPASGDVIEVRKLTTTTTITSLANAQSTAIIECKDGQAVVEITGDLLPEADNTRDLGSSSKKFAEVHATTFTGALTGTASIATTVTLVATNTTDASHFPLFSDSATGNENPRTDTGFTYNPNSGTLAATVFSGTATQAQYADLAEMYAADAEIEPGTVVHFAGEGKLAACDEANHHAVAGIISTDPAHLMNSSQEGVALAIAGRVPCKVTGAVAAGDLMVSAGNGMAMANNSPAIGTVIGKAIEANEGGDAVIEVLAMMM